MLEVHNGCGIPSPKPTPRVRPERGFTGLYGRTHEPTTGMGPYLVAQLVCFHGLHVVAAMKQGTGTRVIHLPHDRTRKELSARRTQHIKSTVEPDRMELKTVP